MRAGANALARYRSYPLGFIPRGRTPVKAPYRFRVVVLKYVVHRQLEPEPEPKKYNKKKVAIAGLAIETAEQHQSKGDQEGGMYPGRSLVPHQPADK